jgi:hypothetical protein
VLSDLSAVKTFYSLCVFLGAPLHCGILWVFLVVYSIAKKEEEKTLENPIEQHLIAVQVRQLGSVLFKFTVLLFIIIQYGRGKQGSKKQPA